MRGFWTLVMRALDDLSTAFWGPPPSAPTALEKATAENIRLKALLRTRELEAENAKLREELGL